MLVKSETLAGYTRDRAREQDRIQRRPSAVIQHVHARKFWDTHFSEQREVEIESLCEALVFEFERTPSGNLDVTPAIAAVQKMLGTQKPVSVLRFTKDWGVLSIEERLTDLLKESSVSRATIPAEVPEVMNLCVCRRLQVKERARGRGVGC